MTNSTQIVNICYLQDTIFELLVEKTK